MRRTEFLLPLDQTAQGASLETVMGQITNAARICITAQLLFVGFNTVGCAGKVERRHVETDAGGSVGIGGITEDGIGGAAAIGGSRSSGGATQSGGSGGDWGLGGTIGNGGRLGIGGRTPGIGGQEPYIEPECPDVPPPVADIECDPLSASSDCAEGMGCYPYLIYPDSTDGCGHVISGTFCYLESEGVQGDFCGAELGHCSPGFMCVVGVAGGKRCGKVCETIRDHDCPSGLICGKTDVQGYGVCY